MAQVPQAHRKAFRTWREECPLRKWRKSHEPPITIVDAASMLGVSMTLIQLWEKGVHYPSPENMTKLVSILGAKTPGVWASWLNQKPIQIGMSA